VDLGRFGTRRSVNGNRKSLRAGRGLESMKASVFAPLGQALLDFWRGDAEAAYTYERDDGFVEQHLVRVYFRPPNEFFSLEQKALDLCNGYVLDVGAGAGSHALILQDRGFRVLANDVAPGAVEVMSARGVREVDCSPITEMLPSAFDTLLLLGRSIGLVEDLEGLQRFLRKSRSLVASSGQVLLTSLDVTCSNDQKLQAYHQRNSARGRYPGEIRFRIRYADLESDWIRWLQVDPDTLACCALKEGWICETVGAESDGNYLARLTWAL
jgi:SAM-dependent methyltransferase